MLEATAAYATLFAWSFLAATVLPLGSEPALFAMIRHGYSVAPVVLLATVGNYLGACTTYWLGRRGAEALSARRAADLSESRAGRLLQRFGQPALLLSWLPFIGDAVVAVSGAVGVRFLPFSAWTFVGKLARYAAVAWGATAFQT